MSDQVTTTRSERWALAVSVAQGRMAGGWVPVDADLVMQIQAEIEQLKTDAELHCQAANNWCERAVSAEAKVEKLRADLRAYEQQCRNAALLEAAELCARRAKEYEDAGDHGKAQAVAVCNVMLHAKINSKELT